MDNDAPSLPQVDYLRRLQHIVVSWANDISPRRKPKDAVVKMVSETAELLDAVLNGGSDDVEGELGDCIILLLDISAMYNIDLVYAGIQKMKINAARTWVEEDGVIRRVKGEQSGTERQTAIVTGEAVPDMLHEP